MRLPDSEAHYPIGSRISLIPVNPTKEIAAELNRCLASPGRIAGFSTFLASLYKEMPAAEPTEAQMEKIGVTPYMDVFTHGINAATRAALIVQNTGNAVIEQAMKRQAMEGQSLADHPSSSPASPTPRHAGPEL